MVDGVLTLIAATDDEALIQTAIAAVRDELTSVGQADWLAPRKACDLFFTDVALHDVGARTRRIIAERFLGASLDFVVQQAVDRRKRLVVADLGRP